MTTQTYIKFKDILKVDTDMNAVICVGCQKIFSPIHVSKCSECGYHMCDGCLPEEDTCNYCNGTFITESDVLKYIMNKYVYDKQCIIEEIRIEKAKTHTRTIKRHIKNLKMILELIKSESNGSFKIKGKNHFDRLSHLERLMEQHSISSAYIKQNHLDGHVLDHILEEILTSE